jgi:hypothetical protein
VGLKKHGKKKCLVYEDGKIPTMHLDAKLVRKGLRYYCRVCGERVDRNDSLSGQ